MTNSTVVRPLNEFLADDTYTITTTAGEQFTASDSAILYAMMYKRFGYDLNATRNAIGRMLQSTPMDTRMAMRFVAAGLALLDKQEECCDYLALNDADENAKSNYLGYLGDIGLRAAFPEE